jgi:hypothetical protein
MQAGDFAENPEPAILRTEMETGPPKQVMVKSRVIVTRPLQVVIEGAANYAAWLTWFRDTIHRGADWFDWVDTRTGATVSARIQGGLVQAAPATPRFNVWKLRLTLETWE